MPNFEDSDAKNSQASKSHTLCKMLDISLCIIKCFEVNTSFEAFIEKKITITSTLNVTFSGLQSNHLHKKSNLYLYIRIEDGMCDCH